MGLKDCTIQTEYRSFQVDIAKSFYIPVLEEAILYQRAVGFFSSTSLNLISPGIKELIKNGGKIQLIASPKLSLEDIEDIKKGYSQRKVIENALIRELKEPESDSEKNNLSFLATLIAEGKLDVKIAVLSSNNHIGMYHEKIGIITDKFGNSIAFSGSMNESENAFVSNYESFDVYCSWTEDKQRVFNKKFAFEAIWNDYESGIKTLEFPEAVKKKVLEYKKSGFYQKEKENLRISETEKKRNIFLPSTLELRNYQKEAIQKWENNGYVGIYDMATGTGKTLTALASVEHLFRKNNERLAVIIVCPYTHLVEQWVEDIVKFGMNPIIGYSQSSQKNWKKRFEESIIAFNLNIIDTFCFVTTTATFCTKTISEQIAKLNENALIVVDEAHNMGAKNYQHFLPENIPYRLALSATVDRHNDVDGSNSLYSYFKGKCIVYSLKDAIDNNMLTRYYYYPVMVYLTPDELDDYILLTEQIRKCIRKEKGKIILTDAAKAFLLKRARLVAGAKNKLNKLENIISDFKQKNHILVYCGTSTYEETDDEGLMTTSTQIEEVINLLGNKLNMRVGRFTSKENAVERQSLISDFDKGKLLQALVAIKCLDEGVNIPSISSAFIMASSTNPKEYIQRRGRVLRKYPGKDYAEIYDFVTLPFKYESSEQIPEDIIRSTKGLIKREIIRMMDFASISENPSKTTELIFKLKRMFNIDNESLKGDEDNVI